MTHLGLFSVLVSIAVILADSDTDYTQELFRHFDHNVHVSSHSVKVLSLSEFQTLFQSLGLDEQHFVSTWASRHLPCDNGAHFFFKEIDGDGSRHIDTDEITYFFRLFDVNEDQEVTEDEFTTAWNALFNGYLETHAIRCSHKGGDDDDRK
ncbi:uncharacterized protein LOC133202178 [Saccostrea echinata]|uniref:uncharacterized protein LOC133202178 n=1 Tax=Saccostrea echinata TaxID=191078 RepID=UPI002A802971|nr:uncharacterized protein LOC133202178 [Saccostrea echinata]